MVDAQDGAVFVHKWWDDHHTGDHPEHRFFLTGSHGPDVWRSLCVEDRVVPGDVVLNIGVGMGYCTRSLAERGCVVHALDISTHALAKVDDVCAQTWLADAIDELPEGTFDLAISHLVAQHMDNATLRDQVAHVVPALKPGGVFAMQFAYRLNGMSDHEDPVTPDAIVCGDVCRSLPSLVELAESAGGLVTFANRISLFPECGSGWYGVHIVRPDFPDVTSLKPRA